MGIKNKYLSIINESGRSMVEVLGTLAIMGVLAIGGIIGYDYGMDKYRANETVNSISLLGIEVISKNHTTQDVDEDELNKTLENEEYIYPTSLFYEAEYDRFGIQITDVPKRVCRLIGDTLADHIETRIEVAESEIDLNKHIEFCNLSDKNTMHFFFEPRKCLPACHANEVCIEGSCQGAECETPDDCNQGYTGTACSICSLGRCQIAMNTEGAECTFDDGTAGQCNQGTCVEKNEEGCTYDTNVCTGGLYCASPNTSLDEAFPEGETGTCIEPRFSKYTINVNGTTEIWHISDNTLSYWDTVAACEAQNWTLPSMTDFVNSWNGSKGSFTRTQRATTLNEAVDGGWGWPAVWTTGSGTEEGNTVHYFVDLTTDYNNVGYAGRNQASYYNAACKETNDTPCVGDECQCTYDTNICTGGRYCAASNTSNNVAFQTGETGTCVEPQFNKYVLNVNGVQETWYMSKTPLSWWDATAACAAQNLTMVSVGDLVNNWTTGTSEKGVYTFNTRATELANQKRVDVWTQEFPHDTSGIFVCLTGTYTNNVDYWSRKDVKFYTLCKQP